MYRSSIRSIYRYLSDATLRILMMFTLFRHRHAPAHIPVLNRAASVSHQACDHCCGVKLHIIALLARNRVEKRSSNWSATLFETSESFEKFYKVNSSVVEMANNTKTVFAVCLKKVSAQHIISLGGMVHQKVLVRITCVLNYGVMNGDNGGK